MGQMPDARMTQEQIEDGFRGALKDVIGVCEKLAPVCNSLTEMVEMATLALENQGQLRLLLNLVAPQGKR